MESKQKKLKVAVIGSGTMGTALAHLIASGSHDCALLTDDSQVVEAINREHRHPHFFNGLPLHPHVKAHLKGEYPFVNAELLVMAVASYEMREVARALAVHTHSAQLVLSVTKGFEPISYQRMSQVLLDELPTSYIGVLAGPNITLDLVKNLPTALLVASESLKMRETVHQAFSSPRINIQTSADLLSCEYVTALKNIVALEIGVVTGLGLGDNFRALVMAKGLAEISELMVKMGLDATILYDLAGLSDIFLTCSSGFAHNYTIGVKMGSGEETLADIQTMLKTRGETAEGLESIKAGLLLAKQFNVSVPLLEITHDFIYGNKQVKSQSFVDAVFI